MKRPLILPYAVLILSSCAHGEDDFANLIGAAGPSSAGAIAVSEAGLGEGTSDGAGGSSGSIDVGGVGGRVAGGSGDLSGNGGMGGGAAGAIAGSRGGSGGSRGPGGALGKCEGAPPPSSNAIITFEDGNAAGLYVYDDVSGGGSINPASNSALKTGLKDGGANGTGKAFEFSGTGFGSTSYGGGVGISLPCHDASALHGIRVWIKSNVKVSVALSTSDDTVAPNGDCIGNANTCVSPTALVDSTGGAWSPVDIPWSHLTGGTPQPINAARVVGVGLVIQRPLGASNGWGWDVWFDELQFY